MTPITTPLDGLNGLVLALPLLAAITYFAPGIVRDAIDHCTRKDLPK